MIDEFYDQIVVKTEYKNINGSGVLIQTEDMSNSYLVTAWHCLNQDQVEVVDLSLIKISRQVTGNMQQLTIIPQDILVVSKNDLVVIKLDYIPDVPMCRTIGATVGDEVFITGFPKAMENPQSRIKRYPLEGKIVSLPGENIIAINSNRAISTYSQTPKDIMSSYSGSGIFKRIEDELFLCGIITELSSPEGAFEAILGRSKDCIQSKLVENEWEQLCDIEVCSFKPFQKSVIEIFEEPMDRICSVHMPNIKKFVVPNDLIKHCGKKLVWPYSDKNLHSKEIWEGWLLYLICRSIEDQENLKNEKYYIVNNKKGNRNLKLIYVTNKTKLSDFLKDYLQNAYRDINEGDFLVIKTKKDPATVILQSSQIDRVVTDISNTICNQQEMRIDEVKGNIKNISLIHIRKMINELNSVAEEIVDMRIDDTELERRLSSRIGEMLYDF